MRHCPCDVVGNMLTAGTDSYTWDWANRLTSASVNGVSESYAYDGDDVRTSATSGGTTRAYLWDRLGEVEVLIDDGARAYLQLDGVLAEIDAGNATTYHLPDALGSIRGLTDGSGSLVGSASYDVFGSIRNQTGATSIFGYTGEQRDSTTGDVYLRARYLDPVTGRLLSADSVQPNAPGTQGYNGYAYVANNPTTWTDPTGHTAQAAAQAQETITLVRPALNPAWLAIGTALGYQVAAWSCAAAPLGCIGALGALAIAIIVIYIIVACVLEIGGPCWTWESTTIERERTEPRVDEQPRTEEDPKPTPPLPPPVTQERRTCENTLPDYVRCDQLPPWYQYRSVGRAIEQIKVDTGFEDARRAQDDPARDGPCGANSGKKQGRHIAVKSGGRYLATILQCPCCDDSRGTPQKSERCAINY